jgi:hypothetical protein
MDPHVILGGRWGHQLHAAAPLPLGKSPTPSTYWIGGCGRLRASLDTVEKVKSVTPTGNEIHSSTA